MADNSLMFPVFVNKVFAFCFSDLLQDNFMLVTSSGDNNLYQVSLADNGVVPIYLNYTGARAVAYDYTYKDIYLAYSDASTAVIGKYTLNNDIFEIIYSNSSGELYFGNTYTLTACLLTASVTMCIVHRKTFHSAVWKMFLIAPDADRQHRQGQLHSKLSKV